MSPRQRFALGPIVAAVLLLGACSDSEDASDTTVLPTDSSASVTTVVESTRPETSDSPATSAPTTVPETGASTTEPAPTTIASTTTTALTSAVPSSEPAATPEDEVVQAIEFFEQQWKECLRALPECDLDAVGERTRGELNAETLSTASAFNSNDYRAENIDNLDYRVDEVAIDGSGMTAIATVCVTDPVTITEADGTPVDARFVTSVQEFRLEFDGDEWEWVQRTTVGEVGESEADNKCT